MTATFSAKPYINVQYSTGRTMFWVNEYFWDHDHWAKYSNRPFASKAKAEAFISEMVSLGHLLI